MLNTLKCVSEEAVSHLSYYTIQNFLWTGIARWLPIPLRIDKPASKYRLKNYLTQFGQCAMINWLFFTCHRNKNVIYFSEPSSFYCNFKLKHSMCIVSRDERNKEEWSDVYGWVINSLTGGNIAEYDVSLRNFRTRWRSNMAVLCFDLYWKKEEHIFWKKAGPLNIWGIFQGWLQNSL